MRLEDKRIVITGATGIAAASAAQLAAEGADVFVLSLIADECRDLADTVPLAGWHQVDLREERAAETAFSAAVETLGAVDGVLAVAGGSARAQGDGPVHEIPLSGWEASIALNLTTSYLSAREGIRAMLREQRGGSLVLVTSILAESPVAGLFATHAYAAAKGAQISMVRAMAAEYASQRIRVNGIAPGLVATPMSRRAQQDAVLTEYAKRKQPLVGGFLEPDAVAAIATFLLSDDSAGMTGQIVAVDGAWSVTDGAS